MDLIHGAASFSLPCQAVVYLGIELHLRFSLGESCETKEMTWNSILRPLSEEEEEKKKGVGADVFTMRLRSHDSYLTAGVVKSPSIQLEEANSPLLPYKMQVPPPPPLTRWSKRSL